MKVTASYCLLTIKFSGGKFTVPWWKTYRKDDQLWLIGEPICL